MSNMQNSLFSLLIVVPGFLLSVGIAVAQPLKVPTGAALQVEQGASLYQQHCALCHGVDGRGGGGFPRPIWGPGHDLTKFGSARGLYEYIQLLMPFDNPQKMTDAEKMAVVAFMLARNGNWKADAKDAALDSAQSGSVAIK